MNPRQLNTPSVKSDGAIYFTDPLTRGIADQTYLTYAGVFRIQNVPQEQVHAVVMIECPRLLFPFAREIIASSVRAGGFPPLLLDPVDFVALYQQRVAQMQQQPAPATA